jgi:hypothetical protein
MNNYFQCPDFFDSNNSIFLSVENLFISLFVIKIDSNLHEEKESYENILK